MRDELLAFIMERLARYHRFGDDSDILDDEVRDRAIELFHVIGNPTTDHPAVLAIAGVFYLRHLFGPRQDDTDLRRAMALYRALYRVDPDMVPRELHPDIEKPLSDPVTRIPLDDAYVSLFLEGKVAFESGSREAVDTAIGHIRFVLDRIPTWHSGWSRIAFLLANTYAGRWHLFEESEDLDHAIELATACLTGAARDPAQASTQLDGLARFLEARLLRTKETADRDAAIHAWQQAVQLAEPASEEYAFRAAQLAQLLAIRDKDGGGPFDLDHAIETLRSACASTADPVLLSERLSQLGDLHLRAYDRTARLADLHSAIDALARAADAAASVPDRQPLGHNAAYVATMANALGQRFAIRGNPSDLDRQVDLLSGAVGDSEGRPDHAQAALLLLLSQGLYQRYLATGVADHLHKSATAARAALGTSALDPDLTASGLKNLGAVANLIYRYTGDDRYRDEAVDNWTALADISSNDDDRRLALEASRRLRTEPHRGEEASAIYLDALAEGAHTHRDYGAMRNAEGLNLAILLKHRLVTNLRPDDSRLPFGLADLATDLFRRYQRTGSIADAETATQRATEAEAKAPTATDRGDVLHAAAEAWLTGYDATGDPATLDRAMDAATGALAAGNAENALSERAVTLGRTYLKRYGALGKLEDAREAADLFRRALTDADLDPARRDAAASHLGQALDHIYEHSGDPAILTEAIDAVAAAAREGNASFDLLCVLSFLYYSLYRRSADSTDLQRAEAALERSWQASSGVPASMAVGLARSFATALDLGRDVNDLEDIDRAIQFYERIIGVKAPSVENYQVLAMLLYRKLGVTRQPADAGRLVDACRRAVTLAVGRPRWRVSSMSSLALALRERFRIAGNPDDITEAVELARSTLVDARNGAWSEVDQKVLLAMTLRDLLDARSDEQLRQEAIELHVEVAGSPAVEPALRIRAAGWAADFHVQRQDWRRAAELYELAVGLLPLAAPETLSLADQQRELRGLGRNAADGAACWLNADEPERAAALLERGRGFLLAQAVARRPDLSGLYAERPELAARFEELKRELSQRNDGPGSGLVGPGPPQSVRRASVVAELEKVAKQIRGVPGFERFLLAPDVDEMKAAAGNGHLVMLNASRLRCDALVLTPGDVRVVPLPEVSIPSIATRAAYLYAEAEGRDTSDDEAAVRATDTLAWLWDAVVHPVLQHTGITAPPRDGLWPRIWWIPDVPFSLLPLHAAGHHATGGPGPRSLLDVACSSYAPSAAMLIRARSHTIQRPHRLLVVAMPTTSGQGNLPHAQAEAVAVTAITSTAMESTVLGTASIAQHRATPEQIMRELPSATIAHLACHGAGKWLDPNPPYLAVENAGGAAEGPGILQIWDVASLALQSQRLAYLSACASARPTDLTQVLDEAIPVTSAFVWAGFTHVIGTMWEIDDQLSSRFAEAFYSRLRNLDHFRLDYCALALHETVRELRDRFPRTPTLWASHIHLGP